MHACVGTQRDPASLLHEIWNTPKKPEHAGAL